MKTYKEFKYMMLRVAKDIIRNNYEKNETINITCSGGMDSFSTVLAIGRYTDRINLLHWNRGRGKYDDTLTNITNYISNLFNYDMQIIDVGDDIYRDIFNAGIYKFIFSDGFDIAFSEIYERYPIDDYGKTLSFSYGESFRSHHPILDVLAHLPDRVIAWNCSRNVSGYERLMSDKYLSHKYQMREGLYLDVIDYDGHPDFVDFFWDYYTPFSDIFSRKRYCQLFIKDMLGMTHQQLIREAI